MRLSVNDNLRPAIKLGLNSIRRVGYWAEPFTALMDENTSQLADYVTFTRSSTGTRYNSAGLLETMAVDAPRYDYDPATVTRANFLPRSQEFSTSPWSVSATATLTPNTEEAPDGTLTADTFSTTDNLSTVSQVLTFGPGTYTASVWVKRLSGSPVSIRTVIGVDGSTQVSIFEPTTSWQRYSFTVVAATSVTLLQIVRGISLPGDFAIWGAQFERGSVATDYILTEASPRGDATLRGLLIEEQRTNLLLRSQSFDNAYWTKTNLTVSANAVVAPDGTLTADTLTATTTAATLSVSSAVTATAAANTYSIYTKKGTATTRAFLLRNSTTATNFAIGSFNYDTGVITGTGWAAQNVGGGWFRLTFTQTTGVTAGDSLICYFGTTGNPDAAGTSWHVWGAQIEAGVFATSYIATTSATVTRAVDYARITDLADIGFNPEEGTLFVEALAIKANNPLNTPTLAAITDGSGANRMQMRFEATGEVNGLIVLASSATQATLNTSVSPAFGSLTKVVGAYKANDFAASCNGSTPALDGVGTLPVVNQLSIGSLFSAQLFNSHIRRLRYYPKRLSNATLQNLTS